jgi:hypothetical protein
MIIINRVFVNPGKKERPMNQSPESETQEMMEEFRKDLGHTGDKNENPGRRKTPSDLKRRNRFLILGGMGILILIILLSLFLGNDTQSTTKMVRAMEARVASLETGLRQVEDMDKRLARLEGMEQRLARLEGTVKGLQQTMDKWQSSVTSKPRDSTAAKNKAASTGNGRYHLVRRGDSLYAIAKKYGITVDALRRYNHLKPKQLIHPGDRLIVSQGND